MKIKKINCFISILLFCISRALIAQNTMNVKEISNVITSYPLTNISKLTFSPGNMHIKQSNGNTTTFPLINISNYNFSMTAVGVKEIKDEEITNLFVFPNPGNSEVVLSYKSIETRDTKIEVIDMKGNIIYQQEEKSQKGKNLVNINVSKFASGLYLFRIHNNYDVETINFLKN